MCTCVFSLRFPVVATGHRVTASLLKLPAPSSVLEHYSRRNPSPNS